MSLSDFVKNLPIDNSRFVSDEEAVIIDAREREAALALRIDALGIPAEVRHYTEDGVFDAGKYDKAQYVQIIGRFKSFPVKGWYIYGKCGIGKSVLMGRIAVNLVRITGNSGMWLDVVILDAEIETLWKGFKSFYGVIKRYVDVPLLFIDDITRIEISKKTEEVLAKIIHLRDNAGDKFTMMTGNGNMYAVNRKYGAPIESRICKMCDVIELIGDVDWRMVSESKM